MRDTTGKIESEIKEVKDQLASLTTSVEKSTGAGQLLETEEKNGHNMHFFTSSLG